MPEGRSDPTDIRATFSEFEAFLTPTRDDYAQVTRQGLISLDTNVLLNLYRYHLKARADFTGALAKLGNRLWIPNRVIAEFWANRESVIRDARENSSQVVKSLSEQQTRTEDLLRHWARRVALEPIQINDLVAVVANVFEIIKGSVKETASTWEGQLHEDTNNDPLLPVLAALLDGKMGERMSESDYDAARTEGKRRGVEKIPPGYKDTSAAEPGDYLVWEQFLRKAAENGCDAIFITGDQKEDWWRIERGQRRGPRPELCQEFRRRTGHRVFLMSPSTFLLQASRELGATTNDESIAELRRLELWPRIEHTLPIQQNARSFLDAVYRDKDYASAWRFLDPVLKICIVQNWLWPILDQVRSEGYDSSQVVDDLTGESYASHPLWEHLAEKQMEGLQSEVDPHLFGTGITTTVLGPHIEVVYFYPPELGDFLPGGGTYPSWPLMMRKTDDVWLVLNYSSASQIPLPGWPPKVT